MTSSSDPLWLLFIGDTHVRDRHRPPSTKPPRARESDNRRTFSRSLARARHLDVDAVVHAGDVFDHAGDVFDHVTISDDRNYVTKEFQRLHDAGIPVYYVNGNHDKAASNRALRWGPGIHLGGETVVLGDGAVRISGLDYGAGAFSSSPPEGVVDEEMSTSLLVMHDTPYPAVDENGSLIYRNDRNYLDLREFLNSAVEWLDLIVSRHLHIGSRGSISGYETPLFITGPTAEISKLTQENNLSTWLMAVLDGKVKIERHRLA